MAITVPNKFAAIWANDEGSTFLTQPIPTASQPAGRASLNDGFPPVTFTNPNAGGVPPDGRDFNGILYMLTAAAQFSQAGGVYKWDSAFSTAVGGYPIGAVVAHATIVGLFWLNTTANNTTNPDAGGAGWTSFGIANQPATTAQLQFVSTTQLTLVPKNGGQLWINGFNYSVPVSNPTVSNSGLSGTTLYYVYAGISGGNMVLDPPSTTGYTVGTNGIAVKSSDATRTLVGMVSTSSGLFVANFTRSYYQRTPLLTRTAFSGNKTTASGTFVELDTVSRNFFLLWAGEQARFSISGVFNSGTGGGNAYTAVGFDGPSGAPETSGVGGPAGNSFVGAVGITGVNTGLAEGLHFATILGATAGGTATWSGTTAAVTIDVTVG